MKTNKSGLLRHLYGILTEKGLKEDRASLALEFSTGRTKSVGELSIEELQMLITKLGGAVAPPREETTQFYIDRDIRINRSIFGYVYGIDKIAPHLQCVLEGKINQHWLKDQCLKLCKKDSFSALEYLEKVKLLAVFKQMNSNYNKSKN